MTLYGPLTADDFLRLLSRLSEGPPDRALLARLVDALVDTFEAERGFLLRVRPDGTIQTIVARNFEATPLPCSVESVSQHAIRLAMASPDRRHHTDRAHIDRRYRTEESKRVGRRTRSILVFLLPGEDGPDTAVYLDHRFRTIEHSEHRQRLAEHWLSLLRLAISIRARESELRRLGRRGARPPAPPGPGDAEPVAAAVPEPTEPMELHGMWTCSAPMVDLFKTVGRLRKSTIPVLITGETGTGKSLLARAFHLSSPRSGQAFLSVNCGALAETLLESELFGHVRGAFTGADADREGLIAQADGGSLFLDEIGDMSAEMQKKLLRFLENGRYRPLGGKDERQGNVRLISSTRLDLQLEVERGAFRPDLYYRLCGIRLELPPLRERREDIVGLATRFVDRYAGELEVTSPRLDESARRWLLRHPWPGNVRELENLMRQLTTLGHDVVNAARLRAATRRERDVLLDAPEHHTLEVAVAAAERQAIRRALGRSAGNKSRAAEILGITRKSLYRRLVKYGLLEAGDAGDGGRGAGRRHEKSQDPVRPETLAGGER